MKKHRPWLYILDAIALIGALGGAAITYLITRPTPVQAGIGLAQERGEPTRHTSCITQEILARFAPSREILG